MIADIVFAVFALFVVWLYGKRGAVMSIFGVLSLAASGIASYFFGPTVGSTLIAPLLGGVEETVYDLLLSAAASAEESVDIHTLFAGLPSVFAGMETAVQSGFGAVIATTEESLRGVAGAIASPVVAYISRTVGCVLVFAVVSIVMLFAKRLIRPILRLRLLRTADGLLGAVLGLVAALVYLWVICLLISVLLQCGVINEGGVVANALSQSAVYRFFCGASPLGVI